MGSLEFAFVGVKHHMAAKEKGRPEGLPLNLAAQISLEAEISSKVSS